MPATLDLVPVRRSTTPGSRARGAILVLCAALAWPGCGQSTREQPPARQPESRPAGSASRLSAGALSGHWQWSLVSDEDGVRRVENETWHITAGRGALGGSYHRAVTFLSRDGVPFECSQTLSYTQRTTYAFEGHYRGRALVLEERSYEATPSPCETGHRALAGYRGELRRGRLILRWPGGDQVLQRAPAPPAGDADRAGLGQNSIVDGRWRWHSRSEQSGEVRVEVEEWELAESAPGIITGAAVRTVTVFDAEGRRFECSGDTFYRYRDRYTLAGRRARGAVTLYETAVVPQSSPCLSRDSRHLDAAAGSLVGEYLVLTWRGNRRQILHRSVGDSGAW